MRELAREADAGDGELPVAFRGKIIGVDARPVERIGRCQRNGAAALRPQLADRQRHAGKIVDLAAGHVRAQGCHVKLDVRRLRFRLQARKQAALIDADRKRAAAVQQPLTAKLDAAP